MGFCYFPKSNLFEMFASTILLVKHLTIVREFRFDTHLAYSLLQFTTPCNEFMNHLLAGSVVEKSLARKFKRELLFVFDKL